jgi:single-stranded DNA-binding protein
VIMRTQKGSVVATGRLTKDPEVKTVGEKNSLLVKFGVAVGEGNETEFVNAVCWRKQAEYAKGLQKGDEVFLTGVDKSREYNGNTYVDTEIKFISKQQSGAQSIPSANQQPREPGEDIDDDCPF